MKLISMMGLLALTVGLVLPGCSDGGGETAKRQVAVSIEPHAWLVRQIAGPDLAVVTVVPASESPATYQPTDAQVTEVMRSRVYFRTGVPFEEGGWFDGLSSVKRLSIVDLREGVALREMVDHHHHHDHDHHDHVNCGGHDGKDPHIWLDPILLKTQAATIAAALSEHFPEQSVTFEANLATFTSQMDALDAELRESLAALKGSGIFVFHPAWGYFTDRYGIQQWPVEIEGKDPSESELSKLIEKARANEARVLFVQPQFRSAVPEQMAKAAELELRTLDPLASDISQTLREAAEAIADSYE